MAREVIADGARRGASTGAATARLRAASRPLSGPIASAEESAQARIHSALGSGFGASGRRRATFLRSIRAAVSSKIWSTAVPFALLEPATRPLTPRPRLGSAANHPQERVRWTKDGRLAQSGAVTMKRAQLISVPDSCDRHHRRAGRITRDLVALARAAEDAAKAAQCRGWSGDRIGHRRRDIFIDPHHAADWREGCVAGRPCRSQTLHAGADRRGDGSDRRCRGRVHRPACRHGGCRSPSRLQRSCPGLQTGRHCLSLPWQSRDRYDRPASGQFDAAPDWAGRTLHRPSKRGQLPPTREKWKSVADWRLEMLPARSTRTKKNGTPRAPGRCKVDRRWQIVSKPTP